MSLFTRSREPSGWLLIKARTGRIARHGLIGAAVFAVTACGRPDLADYRDRTPAFDLVEFFEGESVAWGQFQDRFGEMRTAFTVEIDGEWDGETLTLVEDFVYDDGRTEQRIWTLRQDGPDAWTGTAPGVIGLARGEIEGNAFNWRYDFDLTLPDGEVIRVAFDDWLWRVGENGLINRAYVSRYGVEIGELLIVFAKNAREAGPAEVVEDAVIVGEAGA